MSRCHPTSAGRGYRYFRAKVDAMLVDMQLQAIKLVEILKGERQA